MIWNIICAVLATAAVLLRYIENRASTDVVMALVAELTLSRRREKALVKCNLAIHDALAFPRGFDDAKVRIALNDCLEAVRPLAVPIKVRPAIAECLREMLQDAEEKKSDGG